MAYQSRLPDLPARIRRHDRCRPGRGAARLHAAGLQLDGVRSAADRHRRLGDRPHRLIDVFYPMVQTPVRRDRTAADGAGDDLDLRAAGVRAGAEHGGEQAVTPRRRRCIWVFCAAMGASLTNIFLIYTGESIVRVFFITAGDLRGDEHLWLHDQGRPEPVGQLPDDGADRHHHRQRGEHVPAQLGACSSPSASSAWWCSPA